MNRRDTSSKWIRTETRHTFTRIDPALKPRPGMVLLHKDDPPLVDRVYAYTTPQEMNVNHSEWRLGHNGASLASEEEKL